MTKESTPPARNWAAAGARRVTGVDLLPVRPVIAGIALLAGADRTRAPAIENEGISESIAIDPRLIAMPVFTLYRGESRRWRQSEHIGNK